MLPSLYHLLLQYASVEKLQTLNTVMVAGEACSSEVVLQHFKKLSKAALVNEYGPTEGTVWCTAHHIQTQDAFGSVPIGRPIPYVENFILDKNLQAVPVGVVGELYIGGKGVAQGYWKRSELTAQRFLPHPFSEAKNEKIYKTGDLARFRKDGVIEFLGRADFQIKIRGHRIEPDEIKSIILQHEVIQDATIVVQNQSGTPRLLAYVIPKREIKNTTLREFLKEKLPDYMMPSAFIHLKAFPKLPNGKIDFSKLPEPDKDDFASNESFIAPQTEMEKQLATIWESVLKISPIGMQDNFFEIGGDSIRSIQIIAQAQKAGIEIAPHQLFEYQTIDELAQFFQKNNNTHPSEETEQSNWQSVVSLNKKGSRPPLFCIHSGGGHVFFYQPLAKHLPTDQPLYALQPSGLDGKQNFHNSIEEMATFYIQEMKKIQPTGPYQILGTCFSNAVGLEMANQLTVAGEQIEQLIFVDSGPRYLLGFNERGGKKTLSRFAKMLKDGNWKGIQKKLSNRWFRTKQKAMASFENEQERHLRLTINNLNELYNHYSWKPYEGKITFIRSSEFANRQDKNSHVTQWGKLAKGGLEVHVVEGHHQTLFAEPEVEGLAKLIEQYLKT